MSRPAVAGETLPAFSWATSTSQPDATVERLAAQYRARFVHAPESGLPIADDPLVTTALAHYREYWRTVLMSDLPKEQAEAVLEKRVRRLLTAHGYPQEVDGGVTAALQRAIEQRGYHAITGRTLPYLELMVWRDVEDTRYSVELADGPVDVAVRFVSGFVSRGWVNFATLGKASAGGWSERDRLVCVKEDYDLARVLFESDAPVDAAAFSAVADAALKAAAARLLEDYDRTAATRDPGTVESLIM